MRPQKSSHRGVAQALPGSLRSELKAKGIDTLIGLTASNEEAQRFYKSVPESEIKDVGVLDRNQVNALQY